MAAKRRLRVLALGSDDAMQLAHEALGDAVTLVGCVDLSRLQREYGAAVAREVLRQIVANDPRALEAPLPRRRR